MRTNAWVIVERDRALSWRAWWQWTRSDRLEPEPPLSDFEKKAVILITDQEYLFKAFERPTILGRVWIMLSLYDVTPVQIAAAYAQLGDAAVGGDFGCVGFWEWEPGITFSRFVEHCVWLPAQAIKFMPEECVDPPDCTSYSPAAAVWDVNLLCGQPPRQLPA